MTHPIWLTLAGLGLVLSTACSREDTNANANKSEAPTSAEPAIADRPESEKAALEAPVPKPDLAGARAFIDQIYSQYRDPSKEVDIPFTPELDASIAKQSGGDPTGLGYDIFCECQDPGDPGMLKHTIQSLEPTDDGAIARVSFVIGGDPHVTALTIRLAQRGSKWMVADVIGDDGSLLEKGR